MAKFLDHVGLTHYTGKLKKLLAGKQDKLIGTSGTVLSFDAQSSPIYVQHWSNPNLLDNWVSVLSFYQMVALGFRGILCGEIWPLLWRRLVSFQWRILVYPILPFTELDLEAQ